MAELVRLGDGGTVTTVSRARDPRFWQFKGLWGECWLGPVNDMVGWGSSPYMDWFNETHYIHSRARAQ